MPTRADWDDHVEYDTHIPGLRHPRGLLRVRRRPSVNNIIIELMFSDFTHVVGSNIEPDVYTCAGVDLRNGTQPILDRNGTCVVDDGDVVLLLLTW